MSQGPNKKAEPANKAIDFDMAKKLLGIRDALIAEDYMEAYHQLYSIVCPFFDKFEPWAELEQKAKIPATEQCTCDLMDGDKKCKYYLELIEKEIQNF